MSNLPTTEPRFGFLPTIGTPRYYVFLGAIAILILGPLTGVTGAFMNFSLGFFVGGQVLAGILGSVVTYGYGPEGRHGANYMQTMAASVGTMAALGVLVQAMVWLGMEEPPVWHLMLYFLCIGMLGVGVGMLYTPILVDRLQLTFPGGLAVANILRALTNKALLKKSVGQLGAGSGVGLFAGLAASKLPGTLANAGYAKLSEWVAFVELSPSTFGAGLIVGARITTSAVLAGLLGHFLIPTFQGWGILGPDEPFRKVTFIVALGMIMGAGVVDISLIMKEFVNRMRTTTAGPEVSTPTGGQASQGLNIKRLLVWIFAWAAAVVVIGSVFLGSDPWFLVFGVALVFVFAMVNGISLGVSDSNPISSAFVLSVILMGALGLKDPKVGLLAGAILLMGTGVGCDMQQDRSTGARLGSDRTIQFRYQVIGVTMGAVLSVLMPRLFMQAYPDALTVNLLENPKAESPQWSSAMTYKIVGVLSGLNNPQAWKTNALLIGISIGLATESLRKLLKANEAWKRFSESGRKGRVTEFLVDAVFLPSPYASSFGGFVPLPTSIWFGIGGFASSIVQWKQAQTPVAVSEGGEVIPEDMSVTSLFGGGLIAGESLAALALGLLGLSALWFK